MTPNLFPHGTNSTYAPKTRVRLHDWVLVVIFVPVVFGVLYCLGLILMVVSGT